MYNSFYYISQTQYGNSNITFTWFDGSIYNWVIQTNSVLHKAQIDAYFMPSSSNALLYGYEKELHGIFQQPIQWYE